MISTTRIDSQILAKTPMSAKGFLDWCSKTKSDLGKKAQPTRERYDFALPEIPRGWCWASLSELCERVSVGHVGPTSVYFSADKNFVPLIRSQDVRPGKLHLNSAAHITCEFHQKLKKSKLHSGDILFVRVGANRGDCCIVPSGIGEVNCANIVFARPLVPNGFLGFYFRSRFAQELLLSATTGAAQGVINTECVARMPVPVPSLCIQQRISDILSAYDDLIENNTRRIKILEQMAQMLYREWFVNFRFPGHEKVKMVESEIGKIPEWWTPSSVGCICHEVRRSVNPSEIPSDTPYIGLEHMPRKSIAISDWGEAGQVQSTKLRFLRGEILFGKIRPYFHKVGVAPVDGVCSSDAIVISPKAEFFSMVLLCVSSDDFVLQATQTSQGTKMPRANWDVLRKYPVALPPKNLLDRFGATVVPIVELINNLSFRNRCLRTTRDLLLPKLVSGEIEVPQAEEALEAVTA